jgi:NADH-quinone oxidoreductase subunit C
MSAGLEALGAKISGALARRGDGGEGRLWRAATVVRERWLESPPICAWPDCLFVCFIDVTAADYPQRAERFEVVAHLLSPKYNRRIRIKTPASEETPVASLVTLYPGADWFERETYDLFGVIFSGHPDLRRIMTDYGFDCHPLRKDFPMTGFVEVRYDDDARRLRAGAAQPGIPQLRFPLAVGGRALRPSRRREGEQVSASR